MQPGNDPPGPGNLPSSAQPPNNSGGPLPARAQIEPHRLPRNISPAPSNTSENEIVLPLGTLPDDFDANGDLNPSIISYPAHIIKNLRKGWKDFLPLHHLTDERIAHYVRNPIAL